MSWFNKLFAKNSPKNEEITNREKEISDKLLADRIIFLGTPIDDTAAQSVIARMLFLEHRSPDEDINLYINSPGGSITASFAIYDTIKSIKPDVATVCVGQAGGTAAILAAGGSKGKRFAQPSSRFVFFKVKATKDLSSMSQIELQAYQNELKRMRDLVINTFVEETRQPPKKISAAMQKDLILSAGAAIEFGLIDALVGK